MNCPYCGAQQRTSSDDADGMREEETQARECSSCEKNFTFQIKISLSYTTEKADCLNGGEHAWKPTVTWCIDHKLSFVPYGVLILGAPIFIIAGVAQGIASAFEDWKTDALWIKHEIARRAAAKKDQV